MLILLLPQAHAQEPYRFERLWLELEQPWYFNDPSDVAIGPDNLVYIVDTLNHRIQVFDAQGRFMRAWGSEGTGEGEFYFPSGIAIDASGLVYVTDTGNYRIQVFDAQGRFMRTWGSEGTGEGEFNKPQGIAISSNGLVYVADTLNHRIQVFDAQGRFMRARGNEWLGEGEFSSPFGIANDASGLVYVADWGNNRIQVFDAMGEYIETIASPGSSDGQVFAPNGMAFDSNCALFIVDSGNDRIQKFVRDKPVPVTSTVLVSHLHTVTANYRWQTISISGHYNNPVVIAGPPSSIGGDPGVIRLNNINRSRNALRYLIRFQEWDYKKDGLHALETVPALALEAGRSTMADG